MSTSELRTVLIDVLKEDERRIQAARHYQLTRLEQMRPIVAGPFCPTYLEYLDEELYQEELDDDLREIVGLIDVIAIALEDAEPPEWVES